MKIEVGDGAQCAKVAATTKWGRSLLVDLPGSEAPLMAERRSSDPDRSSDTLIDEKAGGMFKRTKSNASAKSLNDGSVSPFAVDAPALPSPTYPIAETAPLRPRRPSAAGQDEQARRKKDTIIVRGVQPHL